MSLSIKTHTIHEYKVYQAITARLADQLKCKMTETNSVCQDKNHVHLSITAIKLLHSKAAYVLRNAMGLDHSRNLDTRDSTSHRTRQTELSNLDTRDSISQRTRQTELSTPTRPDLYQPPRRRRTR